MSLQTAFARTVIGGVSFHVCSETQVVSAVREALNQGAGGRIVTPNIDILRQAQRDPTVRLYLDDATFVVADGMPLIWASRLAGTPLPERVCGASLIWSLAAGLGNDGRSIYLLGGEPAAETSPDRMTPAGGLPGPRRELPEDGAPVRSSVKSSFLGSPLEQRRRDAFDAGWADVAAVFGNHQPLGQTERQRRPTAPRNNSMDDMRPSDSLDDAPRRGFLDGAQRAADRLVAASPGLRVAGFQSPAYGFDRDPASLAQVCREIVETKPDLVYVGLGFPKQEWLISRLRGELPSTWFLGCGAAVNFAAGDRNRAPRWMQSAGLEWAHRLASEPRRLAKRYLRHDGPYAVRLLASACVGRYRRNRSA